MVQIGTKKMKRYKLSIFADYYQFYLQDAKSDGDLDNSWSGEALDRWFVEEQKILGIRTARNTNVPVVIEIHECKPEKEKNDWIILGDSELKLPSGVLIVAGWADPFEDAFRLQVDPGDYRCRIAHAGIDTISNGGLEGEDSYRVQMWKEKITSED